ncbi:hypothetical protein F8154_03100 [Alkaliphilus pronyensis]|uniref:GerMN domain-containing protein n=1 Tax=Alkaliphilus pronyensis TaxID=1482732 RepID=A0A6I0FLB2_9FIRM|nr:hypothetical protein [Alkaliphilus pronyensis]KAB3537294.1 hypothetical protein F8154_03100 [Alkaliphilus pronyensis]
MKYYFFLIFFSITLFFLGGCTSTNNEEIIIEAGTYEFSYVEVISGEENTYTKKVESSSLEIILNDWISDLVKNNVSYGNNPVGKNILKDLEVRDAYFKGNTLIIVLSESFLYFNEGYTHPVYFINGLKRILSQVTDVTEFSIEVPGYKEDIIHPDGLSIKNIYLM